MEQNKANIIKSVDGKLFIHTPEFDTVKERIESRWFSEDKFIRFYSILEFSSDFINDLAKICSASIMSDNEQQDQEIFVAMEICKEMNINWELFNSNLQTEIGRIKANNYRDVKEYLQDSKFGSNTKNSMLLFEAALHIVLADGIMTDSEIKILADISDILAIPTVKLISRISQFLKFEKEVLVDIEN
jgi:hypothetical protein